MHTVVFQRTAISLHPAQGKLSHNETVFGKKADCVVDALCRAVNISGCGSLSLSKELKGIQADSKQHQLLKLIPAIV